MLCDQLEENVDALLRCEPAVEVAVCLVGFLERVENLDWRVVAHHLPL
jgi:hypothetical protein